MMSILKAFRDALVADATLTALIPAANIYAGQRDEKTPIPAIDVFLIPAPDMPYAGTKIGGMIRGTMVLQVSIFQRTTLDTLIISEQVKTILLGDNETLNSAGIKNATYMGGTNLPERNMIHSPMRFRFNYHYTIT